MRLKRIAPLLAFALVGAGLTYRTLSDVGTSDASTFAYWALQDFRISIYYPVRMFLNGGNPYDIVQFHRAYPEVAPFGLYSPITLLIHLPFGLLTPPHADIADFFLNLALVPILARVGLWLCRLEVTPGRVFGTATLILLSRPGQSCLHLGQSAIYMVIGCYLALGWARSRPWLAGLALALVSVKATFAIPLMFLMFWRRDYRALLAGAAVTGLVTAGILPWLVHAAGGVQPFYQAVVANYLDFRADPSFDPVYSPFRMDTAGFIGRLLQHSLGTRGDLAVMITLLTMAAWGVRQLAVVESEDARVFSNSLICLAALTCTYHQVYDLLVALFPAIALASGRWRLPGQQPRPLIRFVVLGLILVPAFNYLAASKALEHLRMNGWDWILITSVNGAALLLAFLTHVALTARMAMAGPESLPVTPTLQAVPQAAAPRR